MNIAHAFVSIQVHGYMVSSSFWLIVHKNSVKTACKFFFYVNILSFFLFKCLEIERQHCIVYNFKK